MKGIMLFGVGLLVGSAFSQGRVASDGHVRGLNHVGIVVKDYKQAMELLEHIDSYMCGTRIP